MTTVVNFYNSGPNIKLAYTGTGAMNGIVYYYPKNAVQLFAESATNMHVLVNGSIQQNILYSEVSTTNPPGHATTDQLMDILNSWIQQGTINDPYVRDPFARTRESLQVPLFSSNFSSSLESDQYNTLAAGSATVTWETNDACAKMTLATGATSRAVLQSKLYVPSYAGVTNTAILPALLRTVLAVTNNTVSLGMFDEYSDKAVTGDQVSSGCFFQLSPAGVMSVVTRAFGTGSQVDTAIAQTNWNIDKLDGTGRSGFNLDITKVNAYVIEICADAAGTIRFGVLVTNTIAYCHVITGVNLAASATIRHANLPVRLTSANSALAGSGAISKLYGATVYGEGALLQSPWNPFSLYMIKRQANRGLGTGVIVNTGRKPIVSLRLAPGIRCRCPAYVTAFQWVREGGSRHGNVIVRDATLTGASWVSPADSCLQYDVSSTAITGGTDVHYIYDRSGATSTSSPMLDIEPRLPFYAPLDGTAGTVYTFAADNYGINATISGLLSWIEQYG